MAKGKIYKTDMDKIQKKLEEIGSGTFWKAQEGKNIIRVLPPWNDKGLFYFEATLHYGLRREGKERALPCLGRGECPICKGIKKLAEEGSREDQKLAKRFSPRTKYYANILDRKTGKISIWGFSRTILSVLLSAMKDEDDYGDITDPEDGFDVIVDRVGTSFGDTKYQVRVRPKPSEVGDIDWDTLFDLEEEVLEEISEEELEEVVEENLGDGSSKKKKRHEDDGDKDEDEDNGKKKSKSKDGEDDIEVGSQVSFEDEEGEDITGEVIKIDDDEEEARVKDEDGDKHTVSLEDLTLKGEKKKKKRDKDEEEDDDEKARRKRRKERREKRNKKKKRR